MPTRSNGRLQIKPFPLRIFKALLPSLVSSWESLKKVNEDSGKIVIGHLLTNKALSMHDQISLGTSQNSNFSEFYHEVWLNWKNGMKIAHKWELPIQELIQASGISESKFHDFITHFEFQPEYVGKEFKVKASRHSRSLQDHHDFRSFLLENVADRNRNVLFTKQDIILGLGWESRFKTTFNHELMVDPIRYQAIESTIRDLDDKIAIHKGGYLFLKGGPGSGKSTLLTEWIRNRQERIVKYYAFDFTNSSSAINFSSRGDATNLYFDLVLQIKRAGFYRSEMVPYHDLVFLKTVFHEQLKNLGEDYQKGARKTIIIIDGLDHVPREYQGAAQSFLRELPRPDELPEGVFLALGSQSYELQELSQEIQQAWKKGDRSIIMDPMLPKDIIKYVSSSSFEPPLSEDQLSLLVEKSQGHPLYLSYLIEKLNTVENRDEALKHALVIDGNIELYYNKIWEPIKGNARLRELMGLASRVIGSLPLRFLSSWGFEEQILMAFRISTKNLFNENSDEWSFFHNSFRQFLLTETARNVLTDEIELNVSKNYHKKLAELYRISENEPNWKMNFHLYHAGDYDRFISETTSEALFEQMLEFRPVEDIKADIELGIAIAQKSNDLSIMLHYLFAMAEINRRTFNTDPAYLIYKYLQLGRITEAKRYVRNGTILRVQEQFALKAARWFGEVGEYAEGALLLRLAEPDMLNGDGVVIDYRDNIDHDKTEPLRQWAYSSAMFLEVRVILRQINNQIVIESTDNRRMTISPEQIRSGMLRNLAYSLLDLSKWEALDTVLAEFDTNRRSDFSTLFYALKQAAEDCHHAGDSIRSKTFLERILKIFTPENTKDLTKIYISDLVLKITSDEVLAKSWLVGLHQPLIRNSDELSYNGDFDALIPLIKYNKVLHLIGEGVEPINAIPRVKSGSDEEYLAEFQKMVCSGTLLLTDGIQRKPINQLIKRISPMVQFFNRTVSNRNTYGFKIKQMKVEYFDFLIECVSASGGAALQEFVDYLLTDFERNSYYWSAEEMRAVFQSLADRGYEKEKVRDFLTNIEASMLNGLDISGRIEACQAHASSLISISEPESAEHWIKQSFKEAMGIGYRKDYQFNTWIDWLGKVVQEDTQNAKASILWFLSHLDHIRETTEGRAFSLAAAKMLSATLDWNFEAGLQQLRWQMDTGRIEFEDCLSVFISSYLLRVSDEKDYIAVVNIYTELFLLFSTEANVRLLRKVLNSGYEVLVDNFYEGFLLDLHRALVTRSLEETRADLLKELEDFVTNKGKEIIDVIPGFYIPEVPEHRRGGSSENELRFVEDIPKMNELEVLRQVSDYLQFKALFIKEDKANSRFDWRAVLTKIQDSLQVGEIREIAEMLGARRKPIEILTALALRAAYLGEHQLAEVLINRGIAHSSTNGWMSFYDGGSRLKAFEALKLLKGDEGVKKAFEVFGHDVIGKNAGDYTEALEEILPVISPGYSTLAVWEELFAYLQRLMSTSKVIIDLPQLEPKDKPIHDCLIDLLYFLSNSPVFLLNKNARKILAVHLKDNDAYAISLLQSLSIEREYQGEAFLAVLMCAEALGGDLSHFVQQLQNLSSSSNFMLRTEAEQLLEKISILIPGSKVTSLPKFYKPEQRMEDPKRGALYDVYDMVGTYRQELKKLEKLSGILEKTLALRMYEFMLEANKSEDNGPEFKNNLTTYLGDIRLSYSHLKPRVLIARRAFQRLLAELVDCGVIDQQVGQRIFLGRLNPGEIVIEDLKPEFVQRLAENGHSIRNKDWTKNLEGNEALKPKKFKEVGGLQVIGEYTIQRNLNWGRPTQRFMSQLKETKEKTSGWNIFGFVWNLPADTYHSWKIGNEEILVNRLHLLSLTDHNMAPIAINPVLARHLNWLPQTKKMFAWMNKKGDTLVETRYWKEGNMDMKAPHLYSETSEGWYVLASEEALRQIRSATNSLYLEKALSREITDENLEDSACQVDLI